MKLNANRDSFHTKRESEFSSLIPLLVDCKKPLFVAEFIEKNENLNLLVSYKSYKYKMELGMR